MKNLFLLLLCALSAHLDAQYAIGTTQITFTDASRSNRAIACQLFYPAVSAGNNAAMPNRSFPVVVFGHGFTMTYDAYEPVYDSLAKLGYIMVMVTTEGGILPNHTDFAKDLTYTANQMQLLNANSSSLFYNHLNGRTAIGGHSMGAGCTFLADQYGSPAICYFTFAAANTNPSAIAMANTITKPHLVFAGDHDCVAPPASNQDPLYDSLHSACKTEVTIHDAMHCQFAGQSTTCSFGEVSLFCFQQTVNTDSQLRVVRRILEPYLDYYLNGNCPAFTQFQSRLGNTAGITVKQSCNVTVPVNTRVNGPTQFCQGLTDTLTALPTGFNYNWNTGATTTSITTLQPGTFSVSIDNGVCTDTAHISITQLDTAIAPTTITAPDTVCGGIASIVISTDNFAANTYNWTLPTGWSINIGSGTSSITVTSSDSSGTISVNAQNTCNSTAAVSKAITVVPSNLGLPGAITGDSVLCAGSNSSYLIAPVSGAASYTWTLPQGWVTTGASDSNFIAITTSATSGTVTVQGHNQCGDGIASSLQVAVNTPAIAGTITGFDTICMGNNDTLSFSAAVINADTLMWSLSGGWNIISGQGTAVISALASSNNTDINLYAANGCGNNTSTFSVAVIDTPQVALAALNNLLSTTTIGTSYQWYLNDTLIAGAENSSYTALVTGYYSVRVTNAYGCEGTSAQQFVLITGIDKIVCNNYHVYPNPMGGFTTILFNYPGAYTWQLTDVTGKVIMQSKTIGMQENISTAGLSKGIYLLAISGEKTNTVTKLVKE